ncbi:MAG TPA: galactokinase [Longimicrobiales bacterium]|nr:galactokinase [Longimicrobiales bacterium]
MFEPLAEAFRERFDTEPTHASRAPGRVNLIGEHTDYNGLPVLPMALQREARIVLVPREDGVVRLANTDAEFEAVEFEVGVGIEPGPPGHWGNYVKAPAQELARRFAIFRGFDGVLSSDVPVASGLSSSSALVNAVGLALAEINQVGLDALALGDLMADAERFTGTRGGGMDQAISMAARAGHAARIDFNPLRMRHVPVPSDWRFVVADTGVRAEKSGPAQATYNRRRAECEEALEAVSAELVHTRRIPRPPKGYQGLLRAVPDDEVLDAAKRVLDATLLKRFRHVVTENARVVEAQDLLSQADHAGFGTLMDGSHGSLRTDYNVSSAELDELVALANEGGASGARLTGAGFGGCIVALASTGTVDDVLEALVAGYYEPRNMAGRLDQRLFLAVPSDGASFKAL